MPETPGAIPFNRPVMIGGELDYIRAAFEALHTSGDGGFTKKCCGLLEETLGVPSALLTPSCTAALEICAILLDLAPGDEFIVPSFSFPSTVNAFVLRGAKPIFADIRADTLNIDECQVESLIGPKTKAIVVVHYAGVGCEMDVIMEVARKNSIPVVEDNAHGLYGLYRGKLLGTFGCLAAQSFHETKNFSCGEGGALLINESRHLKRAEVIRDKGTNRQQMFRGEVDKYTWVDIGSSYVLSDTLAAVLYAQLLARDKILKKRGEIEKLYDSLFGGWIEDHGVRLPHRPGHCTSSHHMYYLVLPSAASRQALIDRLKERRIHAVSHYMPLHRSRMGLAFGGRDGDCPVTENISERLLRLPFYYELTASDQERIAEEIRSFLKGKSG